MRSKKSRSKVFKFISSSLLLLITIFTAGIGIYLGISYQNLEDSKLIKRPDAKPSKIFDNNSYLVQSIGKDESSVTYDMLPNYLVSALTSIEDSSFFEHDGIDVKRIFSSLLHNISSSSVQGASTLTQQLAKNLFLSPERTLDRKIKEILLSFKLESEYDKKTILEFYFNNVYFDPVIPGISYAASKFFNKNVSDLTLSESALLAGLVKSPTLYEPFKHPENADKRKNIVLSAMLKNNVITNNEYLHASKIKCEDMLFQRKSSDISYPYQAYLDAVYQECKKLIGIDPYSSSIEIYTYLEPQIQSVVDSIQDESKFDFYDELQQFGCALIELKTGHVVAIGGGRDYSGKKLFNRGYDKKVNPASTIKPIFEYLLAVENLNYNKATTLLDEETTYLNGEHLSNATDHYSGKLPLLDALGYSKNTTAIDTLNQLTLKYGDSYLENYLRSINLMDNGKYTESYGLGGMEEGVSLVNLASSYQVIANDGIYNEPHFIKKIVNTDGKVLYEDKKVSKQIVSKEAAYIMKDMLQNLVDGGYSSLDQVSIPNVRVGAKTGTGQYPSNVIRKYHYPSSADRDSLVVGFSNDYSLAVWTGFDKPEENKKTYFFNGDRRKSLTKKIFKTVMETAAKKNMANSIPNSIFNTKVVKYADQLYYPNDIIPNEYTMFTNLKEYQNIETYPLPAYDPIIVNVFEYEDSYEILINSTTIEDELYKRIFGDLGFFITYNDNTYFTTSTNYTIEKNIPLDQIEISEGYENLETNKGQSVIINLNNNIFAF